MKILVVGATGTIGRAIVAAFSSRHEIIQASRKSTPLKVDIAVPAQIRAMYAAVRKVDAVVCAAGEAKFAPFASLTDEDFEFSLHSKLMGQVNLIRYGLDNVRDGGCFVLTSGILAAEPMAGSGAVSLVNAGLEGFMRAAALEAPRRIRVNVVSPPWVTETMKALGMDAKGGLPAATLAQSYVQAVEAGQTGQVFRPTAR
jgi:NAD(P)-dependent dehydrogenase (short-subunit alcohol dehydrogenase family)